MTDLRTLDCLAVNVYALEIRLRTAVDLLVGAREALTEHRQNLAIGTLLPLEQLLPEASALMATILLLHRSQHAVLSDGGPQ